MIFVQQELDALLNQAVDETHRDCIRLLYAIRHRVGTVQEWISEWEPRPVPANWR